MSEEEKKEEEESAFEKILRAWEELGRSHLSLVENFIDRVSNILPVKTTVVEEKIYETLAPAR